MTAKVISIGWEYEVPIADVEAARVSLAKELEEFYHAPAHELTNRDVARFLVRLHHPATRYLRPQGALLVG